MISLATKVMNVISVITKFNNCIACRNIKLSFVLIILMIVLTVNMTYSVLLLIEKMKLEWNSYIIINKTQISSFSTIKHSGVLLTTLNMIEVNVSMLIIGRIIEEDHINININLYHVLIGILIILSPNIKKNVSSI